MSRSWLEQGQCLGVGEGFSWQVHQLVKGLEATEGSMACWRD